MNWALVSLTERNVALGWSSGAVVAEVPVVGGGGGGVKGMQRGVAVSRVVSEAIGDDGWRRDEVMKLGRSGCSGEDDEVGVASVDEDRMQDHVK